MCSIVFLKLHLGRLFPGRIAFSPQTLIQTQETGTGEQQRGESMATLDGGSRTRGYRAALGPWPTLTLRCPKEGGRHLPWGSRYGDSLRKSLCHCPIPGNVRNVTVHISFGNLFCAYLREYSGNKKLKKKIHDYCKLLHIVRAYGIGEPMGRQNQRR